MKTFIKHEREKRGMMQKDLASMLCIAPATLAVYEKDRDPPLDTLCQIADLFDVSLDVLVRGKEKDRPFGRSKDELMKMFSQMSEEEHLWMIALLQASLADKRFQAHLRQEHPEEH